MPRIAGGGRSLPTSVSVRFIFRSAAAGTDRLRRATRELAGRNAWSFPLARAVSVMRHLLLDRGRRGNVSHDGAGVGCERRELEKLPSAGCLRRAPPRPRADRPPPAPTR